ncbi:MAG: hypothetical protein M3P95_08145, partial [Actinomycetota bacterium]|nr:hypothetical protein [Actinomycetota bacterium]
DSAAQDAAGAGSGTDGPTAEPSASTGDGSTARDAGTPTDAGTSTPENEADEQGDSGATAADAPDGWATYTDPAGWSLAHPPGWRAETRDVRGERVVQVTSPEGGGSYVRVSDDGRAEGDPAARWRAFAEQFAARNRSYEEVGIDAVEDFRYTPAADWEFSYEQGGDRLHVVDRMFFTPEGRAYAVLVQGDDDDEVREVFDGVVASFRPAAG